MENTTVSFTVVLVPVPRKTPAKKSSVSGATSYAYKAAAFLHTLMLEVGTAPADLSSYGQQVVACLSDQGDILMF